MIKIVVLKCGLPTAYYNEKRGSVVVSRSAWHAAGRGSIPRQATRHVISCKNLALNIRGGLSPCLSEETLKAVGPFYLVSMPGEVKRSHTGGKMCNVSWTAHSSLEKDNSLNHSCASPKMGCLE